MDSPIVTATLRQLIFPLYCCPPTKAANAQPISPNRTSLTALARTFSHDPVQLSAMGVPQIANIIYERSPTLFIASSRRRRQPSLYAVHLCVWLPACLSQWQWTPYEIFFFPSLKQLTSVGAIVTINWNINCNCYCQLKYQITLAPN